MSSPTSHAFYERLRRAKASSRAPDELDKLRKTWLADLDALFEMLQDYLKPGVDEKLLSLEPGEIELCEESLGTYTAPTLTIHMPGHLKVRVEPVAMEVLGGRHTGRVDLISGPNKARLLRGPSGEWVLGMPSVQFGRMVFDVEPLTAENLLAVLDGLTA
jgi:hypothetical protein